MATWRGARERHPQLPSRPSTSAEGRCTARPNLATGRPRPSAAAAARTGRQSTSGASAPSRDTSRPRRGRRCARRCASSSRAGGWRATAPDPACRATQRSSPSWRTARPARSRACYGSAQNARNKSATHGTGGNPELDSGARRPGGTLAAQTEWCVCVLTDDSLSGIISNHRIRQHSEASQ